MTGRGFVNFGCFFRLLRSPFRRYCEFEISFLRPGRFPGGGHYRLLGFIRNRLRFGFRMWVCSWSCCSLDDTPPSDEVIPPITQAHLLGKDIGPQS